ncbi:MAG: putative transposase [Hyphomicrobiaceae bacterium]|jgi:putative transposase
MKDLALIVIHLAVTVAKLLGPGGTRAVVAENLLLKKPLTVLRRSRRRAPNLTAFDRFVFGFEALFLAPRRLSKIAIALRPSTLLRFHDALVQRKYRRLFSSPNRPRKPGPKGPSEALIHAIVELKSRNPRFGCPRIALIITTTFGVEVDRNLVRCALLKHYRAPPGGRGPSWLTFIGHSTDSLWSIDLFRCESVVLHSYWVLLVMDQFTRRIVGFGIQCGAVDGPNLCRMFNEAVSGQGVPHYVSTDHDPLFKFHRWRANLRILEVDEIKTVPHTPVSHPFVERLIGTTRREFLHDVLFWNGLDLQRKLANFRVYYNAERVHSSLDGNTPLGVTAQESVERADLDDVRWRSHCRGLVQLPIAA